MDTLLHAIETTAIVDDERHFDANSEINEADWLTAAVQSQSYSFLNDPREDIYTAEDGKPFSE